MFFLIEKNSFDNLTIDVLTPRGLLNLYTDLFSDRNIHIQDKLKYFSDFDMDDYHHGEILKKTLRFFVLHDKKDILGICKVGKWDNNPVLSLSYLSIHEDHKNKGYSKMLLEEVFEYVSTNYPGETFHITGYSIDGWKYMRPTLLNLSDKYKVKLKEKPVEHLDGSAEGRELLRISRELIGNPYDG